MYLTEKEVRLLWKVHNVVKELDKQNKDGPKFNFYDGPPFASGNPHHGHLLTSTIKDTIIRFFLLMGYNVGRRWGWDTHGVPIESKANSELDIKTKDDVEAMGVGNYNRHCRKFVMQCPDKWCQVITKLGRWVNMSDKDSYKTMDFDFMNSVWYMFKELHDRDLIYNGVKIMSYSPKLECPLSNNEANQNYKRVSDPSLTVVFPAEFTGKLVDDDFNPEQTVYVNVLVWTTTPWTLPSNMLICLHPDLEYAVVFHNRKYYFLLESRIKSYFKKDFKVVNKVMGKDCVGIEYIPLFTIYKDFKPANQDSHQFRIVADTMVSSETGTGIVHIAPGFGQEDKDVSDKYGLTSDTVLPPCPLDDKCHFTEPVTSAKSLDFLKNRFCKDCDKDIIKHLKGYDRVFKYETMMHDYPHCYRTDCPLIYRTCDAYFIKVKQNKEKIIANLKKTNWVPSYVKDNKYMQALESCVDWCISRNRYWGTPLPIWTNGDEVVVVGSAKELEEKANFEPGTIVDLHPEFIWDVKIKSSKPDGKPLENVRLVLDCWFESGSMPFGQWGYPYNDKVKLDEIFPADFIAEGTDQTRGWFHAMLTLYTLVLDRPPFKNVIVNGIVQSRVEGKKNEWTKMSKKDGNYEDPETVIDKYGADTLRMFLVKSPGVRAGDVPFDTNTFKDIHKNYYIMIDNMVKFWEQSYDIYNMMYGEPVKITDLASLKDKLTLVDIWIIQELQLYMDKMTGEYKKFQLYYLADHIGRFIDRISRWYIKLNKKNLKGENGQEMFMVSINVLTYVLYYLNLLMAPITPFMTEAFYIFMKHKHIKEDCELFKPASIHLHRIKDLDLEINDVDGLMDAMDLFIKSLELTRQYRAENSKPLKMPLSKVVIAYNNPLILEQLSKLSVYMKQEINSNEMVFESDPFKYIKLKYKPNRKEIGKTFRKDAKAINKHLESIDIGYDDLDEKTVDFDCPSGTKAQLDKSFFDEYMEVNMENITTEQSILYDNRFVMVFNGDVNEEIMDTYFVNCVAREIQEMRKENKLKPTDHIDVTYKDSEKMDELMAVEKWKTHLENIIHQPVTKYDESKNMAIMCQSKRDIPDSLTIDILFHPKE